MSRNCTFIFGMFECRIARSLIMLVLFDDKLYVVPQEEFDKLMKGDLLRLIKNYPVLEVPFFNLDDVS